MENKTLDTISKAHNKMVLGRRLRVLAEHLQSLMPETGRVLDIGCGNGVISKLIMDNKPGLKIEGIDVLARPTCAIPMHVYDGDVFPYEDNTFDVTLFTDVLHHTPDPLLLMKEAARVSKNCIIIKDHLSNNWYAERTLAFMDWVGNRPHGVVLPYNYFSKPQWDDAFNSVNTSPDSYITELGLYPWFAKPFFEKGLHFIARLPV